jgi:hypothetical protein
MSRLKNQHFAEERGNARTSKHLGNTLKQMKRLTTFVLSHLESS